MAKNWGDVTAGTATNYSSNKKKSDSDSFFDKVDATESEMSSMGGSLQTMIAHSQQAKASQAATAAPGVGMGLGGGAGTESEDET